MGLEDSSSGCSVHLHGAIDRQKQNMEFHPNPVCDDHFPTYVLRGRGWGGGLARVSHHGLANPDKGA